MKILHKKVKLFGKQIINKYFPNNIASRVKKTYYAWLLRRYSEQQEPELAAIKHCVKQGDSVVDIGANIGVYTKFLSRLAGAEGRVYSIEPIPSTFEILRSNIAALKMNNIEALNCACTDHNGQVTMEVPYSGQPENEDFYGARITFEGSANNNFRKLTIDGKTLDSVLGALTKDISFIKCDVEGNENNVLKGAAGIIARFHPIWFIEIVKNPDDYQSPAYETFSLLKSLGYAPFYFDDEKLRPRKTGIKKINYFFLNKAHVLELTKAGMIAA